MNLFMFWKNEQGEDELITAPLDGTILEGVTRQSVIDLARQVCCGEEMNLDRIWDFSFFSTVLHLFFSHPHPFPPPTSPSGTSSRCRRSRIR